MSDTPPDDATDREQKASNEKVEEFLREKNQQSADKTSPRKLNLDAEDLTSKPGTTSKEVPLEGEGGVKQYDADDIERQHPATDPELRTARKTLADLLKEPGVELTKADYRLFVKHLLLDEPVRMEVEPLPGVSVVVRDCTVHENNLVMHALAEDQLPRKDGAHPRVFDTVSYATYAQIYYVALRLVSVGGMQYDPLKFTDTTRSYVDAAEELRAHAAARIETMPQAKWSLVERAVRIVNTKLIMLREEMRTNPENFSEPANSDS